MLTVEIKRDGVLMAAVESELVSETSVDGGGATMVTARRYLAKCTTYPDRRTWAQGIDVYGERDDEHLEFAECLLSAVQAARRKARWAKNEGTNT